MRRAVVADAGRIAEINVDGWRTAYRGLMPDSYLDGMRVDRLREQWAARVRAETAAAAMFVAVGEDSVVRAYAFVRSVREEADRHPVHPTGEVCAIYADPAWRGAGAGHAVHQAALEHLVSQGFRHVVLWVLTGNAPSRRFYEAHGWTCDGVEKDGGIAREPTPEIRYSRPLHANRM